MHSVCRFIPVLLNLVLGITIESNKAIKVLCLHGYLSDGEYFKEKLQPLISRTDIAEFGDYVYAFKYVITLIISE